MSRESPQPSPAAKGLSAGLAWTTIATVCDYGLNLLRVMIVARILTPAEFGLFSMCMTVLLGIGALGDFGLKEAFIAHDYEDETERRRWLHSLWTGNLLIKTGLGLLIAALAWPASWLYGEPDLVPMILALGSVPMLTALNNPTLMLLEKRLSFRWVALFEVGVALFALTATVTLALLLESAWALVLGQIAAAALGALLSYALDRTRPRLRLDREPLVKSLGFGKYLMFVAVMNAITSQFDKMFIGAKTGAVPLGIYTVAHRISTIPKLMLAASVARTLFPFYSATIVRDRSRLGTVWADSFGLIAWLLLAAYLPLFFCAEFYIVLLFGEQWRAAAPILEVLALVGLLSGLSRGVNPLLKAVLRTDLEAAAKTIESLVFVPAVIYGVTVTQSPVGAAWGALGAYAVGILARLSASLTMTRVSPGRLLRRLARPAIGAAVMVAAAWTAWMLGWHPLAITAGMWLIWGALLLTLEPTARRFTVARLRTPEGPRAP